jgi:N-acetylmuramoyl-L-alanine amidase
LTVISSRPSSRRSPARPLVALWLALFVILLAGAPLVAAAQQRGVLEVIGVRFGINESITRIVIDVDGPADFSTRILQAPPRLVVDLEEVRWRVRDHPQNRPTGLATGVSYGRVDPGRSRLVVDVDRPFRILRQDRLQPSGDARHHRILVDIEALPRAQAPPASAAAPEARPAPASNPAPTAAARLAAPRDAGPPIAGPPRARPTVATGSPPGAPAGDRVQAASVADLPLPGLDTHVAPGRLEPNGDGSAPRPPDLDGDAAGDDAAVDGALSPVAAPVLRPRPPPHRLPVIAIDPGHGGKDPGTVGINGVLEKEVTLDVARRLRTLIERTGRYEVVLTRDADVLISLRERMERARRADAALFISVHADSLGDSGFRGASVYTLSDQASDAEAARLAAKENRADVIAGTDLSAHDEVVAGILIDLAQRVTNNKSIEFADVLAGELADVTALVRNTRRFAGFVVLKSPDVPSVLLELGYLSNPTDAANLARPEYRDKLARSTVRAIDRYFASLDAAL